MAFTFNETVNTSVASGSSAPAAQLSGSVAVGDLIVLSMTVYGTDSDAVSGCSDNLGNTYLRAGISPAQGMNERVYRYYSNVTNAGTPAVAVTHAGGSTVVLTIQRISKPVGTLSVLNISGNGGTTTDPALTLTGVPANSAILGAIATTASLAAATGYTSDSFGAANHVELMDHLADSGSAGNKTATWVGSTAGYTALLTAFSVSSGVTITDSGDESHYNGETAVPIVGTGFGASQGSGKVYLSPTNDVADAGRVEQTVTSWGDTAIAFTCVKGGLSLDTTVYLFVVNNSGASNAAGYAVKVESRPYVRDTLINEVGATVNSLTGVTMTVWHSVPTTASPNPAQVIENVSTDGAGAMNQVINRGALAVGAAVWIGLMKDGSPAKGTLRKVTPVYE